MEVFLLYILKSGICLAVFYVCFKALFSNDTFFRFNRRILLVGTGICMLLPLCRIKTSQPLPFSYTTSQWEMVFHEEEVNLLPAPDKEEVLTGMTGQKETSVPWVGIIGIVYFIGCCICLVTTVLSFRKMYQLSRSGRKLQQGKYTLILLPGSFSVGGVISSCRKTITGIIRMKSLHTRKCTFAITIRSIWPIWK